ncbi:hypothetical protein ACWU4D_02615 [Vibrio sp. WJH972]
MTHFDLSALLSLMISSISLISIMIFIRYRNTKESSRRRKEGIKWLKQFRLLLALVQQHRGLSNGLICGDKELLHRLTPLSQSINQLRDQLIVQGSWLSDNDRWSGIDSHWQRLSVNFETLSAKNNFDQHCKLITNILYLIDDVAEEYRLYEVKDKQEQSIRYLWQDLLVTAENIGQARALGTGVAAAGICTSVDRIRLSYLHQSITNVVKHSSDKKAVVELLQVIEQKIIIDVPTVNAKSYFDSATVALESVLSEFDAILEEQM